MISCCAVGVYSGPDRKAKQADKGWKPGLNNTDKYQGKDRSERRNLEPVCWRSYQFLLSALSRAVQSWQEQQIHSTLTDCTAYHLGQQEISVCRRCYQDWTLLISRLLSHQYSPPQNNKYVHSRATSGLYSLRYYQSECICNFLVYRRHKCIRAVSDL